MIAFTESKMKQFGYKDWKTYFEKNDAEKLTVDFSQEKELPNALKNRIFPSIRAFQKGEGSDGEYLMKTVRAFAEKSGESDYPEVMELFIKEENQHSAYLKTYMEFHRVTTAKKSFLDAVFRKLRQLGGLKCEVTILVTAEMIALTYYDALSKCTDSAALKSICSRMLHDEIPHVLFQSYTLSHFRAGRPERMVRRLVMHVTLFFVWCACHKVYRAGGYGYVRFLKENHGYLRQSIQLAERKR